MNILNSSTGKVLRIVGSPFVISNPELDAKDALLLYQYATRNRMPLLYLEALSKFCDSSSLVKEHNRLCDRYTQVVRAISRVSQALDKARVDYAFFKSIRPYREVTVDLDVLIFSSKFEKVIRDMYHAGYAFLGGGPLSVTFRDVEAGINIDLYYEIGASRVIYLDKYKLRKFVVDRKLSNGEIVRSLDPKADLLTVIAHSVIKEQMYVLSEYYTTLYSLASGEGMASNSLISLADECKVRTAFQAHIGISALLHQWTFGYTPDCLMRLSGRKDLSLLEYSRFKEADFLMPLKYHPLTVAQAFLEKCGEIKARKSFIAQIFSMLNPNFASIIIREVLRHSIRETY